MGAPRIIIVLAGVDTEATGNPKAIDELRATGSEGSTPSVLCAALLRIRTGGSRASCPLRAQPTRALRSASRPTRRSSVARHRRTPKTTTSEGVQ